MPKFSIIIPVYNVQQYIDECLNSILNQSFTDYEIILVNDGSTDNSKEICETYHKRGVAKLINKTNGGLSDARNAGLQIASGEYILFVDSDDYISENSLNNINKTLEEKKDIDLIFLEATKIFASGEEVPMGDGYEKSQIYLKNQKEVIKYISTLPKFPGSACTKLIRRDLILDNNIFFEKGLLSEDIDWTIRLLLVAQKFNYCSTKYYCYRQGRVGSITTGVSMKNVEAHLYIISKWAKVKLNENNFQEEINVFMAYLYSILLAYYGLNKKNCSSEIRIQIKSYEWLLSYGRNTKGKIIKILYKILGFEIMATVLSQYLKLRT